MAVYKSSIMEFQTCKFTFNAATFGGAVSAIQNCQESHIGLFHHIISIHPPLRSDNYILRDAFGHF